MERDGYFGRITIDTWHCGLGTEFNGGFFSFSQIVPYHYLKFGRS